MQKYVRLLPDNIHTVCWRHCYLLIYKKRTIKDTKLKSLSSHASNQQRSWYIFLSTFPQLIGFKRKIAVNPCGICIVLSCGASVFPLLMVKADHPACSCPPLKTPGTHSWKIDLFSWSIYQGSEFKPYSLYTYQVQTPRGTKEAEAEGGGQRRHMHAKAFGGEALNQSCLHWEHYASSYYFSPSEPNGTKKGFAFGDSKVD